VTGGTPTVAGDARTVIGLEIHVQLRTATKMFCGCRAEYGGEPNTRVCPVCMGLPGALPVANARAVELGIRTALALGCEVRERCRFDRKNYFYPDLPKGYQITQYHRPLATDGALAVPRDDGERRVGIRRVHLEEDAGRSVHDRFPGATGVDLNRAGLPLAEIVTEPDLRSPGEARAFLDRLKQVLEHYARVSDCNMEEGSLRVDANLSVEPRGGGGRGARTEVKNLNSFRNVERALEHERDRQLRRLESGEAVEPETRRFDASSGRTRAMRGKEGDVDYRYFPEPDLPPLSLPGERVEAIRRELPELPHRVEERLRREHGLPRYDARRLAAYPERAEFFGTAVGDRGGEFAKEASNLILGKVAEELNARGEGVTEPELLDPADLRRVVELRRDGTLSSSTADEALGHLCRDGAGDADEVVREHGLAQVSDSDRLARWVDRALAANPEEVRRYAAGEEKLLGFFMGAVMRLADGRADPEAARALLRKRLEEEAAEGPGG
jgi:aspartyl-tRNA(Asn)/glutamyl-tRNA(Gln) amidotransferase subunit B